MAIKVNLRDKVIRMSSRHGCSRSSETVTIHYVLNGKEYCESYGGNYVPIKDVRVGTLVYIKPNGQVGYW